MVGGARDLVRWAIGSRGGGNVGAVGAIGSMPTLGGGDMPTLGGGSMATRGGGVSANIIRRGVTELILGTHGRKAETAGRGGANRDKGVMAILGDDTGGGTGVSGMTTLGRPGVGLLRRLVGGGARRRQDSKTSLRFERASSCEIVAGGGVSVSASVIARRPWTILSSDDGAGTVR